MLNSEMKRFCDEFDFLMSVQGQRGDFFSGCSLEFTCCGPVSVLESPLHQKKIEAAPKCTLSLHGEASPLPTIPKSYLGLPPRGRRVRRKVQRPKFAEGKPNSRGLGLIPLQVLCGATT